MMRRRALVILLVVGALVVLTAALASADEHVAMVSVGHGIPGTDIGQAEDALPVDVIVDGECSEVQALEFGNFAGPLELEEGMYSVAVALSDGDPDLCEGGVVIGPLDLEVAAGDNATVFAHLTADGEVTATVFDNDVSDIVAGHTRLTVRHTAAAPAVDIFLNRGWIRGRSIAEVEGLENPDEAGPLDLRPGAYAVSIFESPAEEGDDPLLQIPATEEDMPFVTHPHRSQIVYAVGSSGSETFAVMVQTIDLQMTPPPHPVPPG
jgi:hypothetical protein